MTRVALLREGAAAESPSMRIYADHLASGLTSSDLTVECPDWVARATSPFGRYWTRYRGIPGEIHARFGARRPREPHSSSTAGAGGPAPEVYHILDHANAHWIRALPADRTVVTCHDLMLLKLLAGDVGSREGVPLVAAAAFRWSVGHLRHAAAVVCDSEATRADLRRLLGCGPERLHVIPPGLDPAFRPLADRAAVRAHARNAFGVTAPVMLLHVGHHFFYKNLEGLLQALARLPRLGIDAQLVKVGERLTDDQRNLVRRLELGRRVREVGPVDLDQLVRLYNAADAVVYPSFAEGFGWPLVEAMACGTPLVCSDRGALSEITAGAACLIDPDEPSSIAEGIARVLADERYRRALITRGLARASDFKWDDTLTRLRALYGAVASRSARLTAGVQYSGTHFDSAT